MKLILPIILVLILVGGYFVLKQTKPTYTPSIKQVASPSPKQNLKTFQSKFLKFSILIPKSYETNETLSYVDLIQGQLKINISKNSTNFLKVTDYVNDFDKKRVRLNVKNEKIGNINELESISRLEEFTSGPITQQKIYYFYTDNKVYTISTSSPSLYPDLDQIAQSFHYTP